MSYSGDTYIIRDYMAYQLSYWKYANGPDRPDDLDEVIPPRRITRVSDIHNKLRPIPSECDVVSLDRTDKRSTRFNRIWERNAKTKTRS